MNSFRRGSVTSFALHTLMKAEALTPCLLGALTRRGVPAASRCRSSPGGGALPLQALDSPGSAAVCRRGGPGPVVVPSGETLDAPHLVLERRADVRGGRPLQRVFVQAPSHQVADAFATRHLERGHVR